MLPITIFLLFTVLHAYSAELTTGKNQREKNINRAEPYPQTAEEIAQARKRNQNRVAAQKYRQRKKDEFQALLKQQNEIEKARQIKNRKKLAARRARQKKKAFIFKLQDQLDEAHNKIQILEQQNENLFSQLGNLPYDHGLLIEKNKAQQFLSAKTLQSLITTQQELTSAQQQLALAQQENQHLKNSRMPLLSNLTIMQAMRDQQMQDQAAEAATVFLPSMLDTNEEVPGEDENEQESSNSDDSSPLLPVDVMDETSDATKIPPLTLNMAELNADSFLSNIPSIFSTLPK